MRNLLRKGLMAFFLLTEFLLLNTTTVKANSGPPANVQITVLNNEIDFEFDLLIHKESSLTQTEIDESLTKITDGDLDHILSDETFAIQMASYQDSEGFVSNALYGNPDYYYVYDYGDERGLIATMYLNVPREFKILIYTETGATITSELITMSQFDYRLTFDLSGIDMSIDQSDVGVISGFVGNPLENPVTWVNFLLRMLLTLLIELIVLYLFGFRKKATFMFVIGMNIFSQVALNIATIWSFYLSYDYGYQYAINFIIGEFLIFIIEPIMVSVFVKEHHKFRKIAYSLCANTASLVIGLAVASSLSFLI